MPRECRVRGSSCSPLSRTSSGTVVLVGLIKAPRVLAANRLFPYIQLYLQGLQHPAPPYGAFLSRAPVLRWGCEHPGLQSSPGKNGDQQQHQTVTAGNLWRSRGNKAVSRTGAVTLSMPFMSAALKCHCLKQCSFPMHVPRILPSPGSDFLPS